MTYLDTSQNWPGFGNFGSALQTAARTYDAFRGVVNAGGNARNYAQQFFTGGAPAAPSARKLTQDARDRVEAVKDMLERGTWAEGDPWRDNEPITPAPNERRGEENGPFAETAENLGRFLGAPGPEQMGAIWQRLGFFLLGVALILIGAAMLAAPRVGGVLTELLKFEAIRGAISARRRLDSDKPLITVDNPPPKPPEPKAIENDAPKPKPPAPIEAPREEKKRELPKQKKAEKPQEKPPEKPAEKRDEKPPEESGEVGRLPPNYFQQAGNTIEGEQKKARPSSNFASAKRKGYDGDKGSSIYRDPIETLANRLFGGEKPKAEKPTQTASKKARKRRTRRI